jgi:hypothetical protein
MNVRGLQFWVVVGIMALGAAPSFGQILGSYADAYNWPVVPADPDSGRPAVALSGRYYFEGSFDQGGTEKFTYRLSLVGNYFAAEMNVYDNGGIIVELSGGDGVYTVEWNGSGWDVGTDDFSVGAPMNARVVGSNGIRIAETDEFREAFPDWESAAVKIPLGFGLGMAFWAAAVALSLPIKWAKDLASAAS